MLKQVYYAVRKGRQPGIFLSWSDCLSQVSHFSGAEYKKFFTLSEAEQFLANSESYPKPDFPVLFTDGGSRDNPGIAGCGAVLLIKGRAVSSAFRFLGTKVTNNVAEYSGLIMGLSLALAYGVKELEVRTDSLLVVKQMTGEWQVRENTLRDMNELAKSEAKALRCVRFVHVRREENKLADELANKAMDLYKKE
jgi:ribonuclease HI